MRGDKKIIDLLNKQLTNELTAINQYFLHARMARHWGFERLGSKIYDESIGEMKHADKLIARILLLDGLPNLQALNKLQIGENVPEVLQADLALEKRRTSTSGNRSRCARPPATSCPASSSSTSSTTPRSTSTGWRRSCS